MDCFPLSEGKTATCGANPDNLIRYGLKMHLDTTFAPQPPGLMSEIPDLKIAVEFPIDAAKEIQIEGGGNAGGVIVRLNELALGLNKIGAQ
jgi:hypothetical protein